MASSRLNPVDAAHQRAAWAWSVLVAAVAIAAPRPALDNSVAALMRSDAPEVSAYRRFQRSFGSDEVVVARLTGGTASDRFRAVDVLTSTLAETPAMQGVLSVTALHPDRTTVILDEVFGGPDALAEQTDALRTPLVQALGLWETSSAASAYGLATVSPPEARARLADRLESVRRTAAASGVTLHVTGPPLLNLALDRAGRRTEATALPLLLVVSLVALLVATGSPRATAALLIPIGLAVLAIDGAFGALGGVTNLLVNIAKPLLFVIGLASAAHVYFGARAIVEAGGNREAAPWRAARGKAAPVCLALGTTAIGFGSLALSEIAPIRAFGQLTSIGLLVMIPAGLLGVPAALALARQPRPAPGWAAFGTRAIVRLARSMVRSSLHRPWLGPAVGVLVVAVGFGALGQLEPEPHAIRYFAPEHPLRRDQAAIERAGLGIATVETVIRGPNIARDPTALPHLRAFAAAGRTDPAVARAVGWPDIVDHAAAAAARASVDEWLLDEIGKRPDARAFAHAEQVRIAFIVHRVDAAALDRFRAHLRAAGDRHLAPGWSLEVTGNYALLLQAQDELLRTLQVSLVWTALLMQLILLVALRSVWIGLVAILPNLVPVAMTFTVMAVLGIPLDLGTSMTAAIALGIAVDDTLHFAFAVRHSTITYAAQSTGASIVLSSVVIGLGFAALMTAEFLPTQRFGGLCALAMAGALVADLFVLPPLLRAVRGGEDH